MKSNYFVTGATGAIGSMLVPLLLDEPETRIWLLIRAKSPEHLRQRLEELIEFWELDATKADDARQRITLLQGDTDQPRFGLSEQAYGEIVKSCTHIIHSAGVVRMNLPLDTARKHALGAVKNIVELARACQAVGVLRKVEYVSTVGVAGKMSGLVPEAWILEPRQFHNTYEQSKAEAEDYLREQIELYQLPVTVHRPSMVVGHSKTGKIIHFQVFYYICDFLSGKLTFGLLPRLGQVKLDIIPVNYVTKWIKASSQRQDNIGRIHNICSGSRDSIKLTHLQRTIRKLLIERNLTSPLLIHLPASIFNKLIRIELPFLTKRKQKQIKSFSYFLDYLSDNSIFDNTTLSEISTAPDPEEVFLKNIINAYFIKRAP